MSSNFTTIRTADILDAILDVYDAARPQVDARWAAALDRALDAILLKDELIYDVATHSLKVESATSDRVYIANGSCGCQAYARHNACWHRAAARLVRRALEMMGERDQGMAALATAWGACPEPAPVMSLAEERVHLAGEIYSDLLDAGMSWEDAQDASAEAANHRLAELLAYAAAWDAEAAAIRDIPLARAA